MNNTDTEDALTEEKLDLYEDYADYCDANRFDNFSLRVPSMRELIKAARHGVACRAIDPEAHKLAVEKITALKDECNHTVVLLMKFLEVIGRGFRKVQVYRWREDAKVRLHNLQTALAANRKEAAGE